MTRPDFMKMDTCIKLLLLMSVTCIFGDQTSKRRPYNIIKGVPNTKYLPFAIASGNRYPSLPLCRKDNEVELTAKVIYTRFNTKDILVVIEATSIPKNKVIGYYEVENSNLRPSSEYDAAILEMNLCSYFRLDIKNINNERYFFMKFYFEEKWWCDVYKHYSFQHQDMDKCEVVLEDYKILDNHKYHSVDIPERSFIGNAWSACYGGPPETLCTKDTHFTVTAAAYCNNGLVRYHITTAFNNLQLGTYKISSLTPDQAVVLDAEAICRMFRFIKSPYRKEVLVQYFKNGQWRCQKYVPSNDGWVFFASQRKGRQYNPQMLWGNCDGRYRRYKVPNQEELYEYRRNSRKRLH